MHQLKINKTARIATYGNANAENVWFVLHGYGHLVPYFIKKFHELDPEKNFVIAPEGLHRFYLQGTSGRVGASWMTKEEREVDIEDYVNYLDQVYLHFKTKQYKNKILLGFSQGVATASRWMAFGQSKINIFINWSGVFPSDIENKDLKYLKTTKNYFVYGNNDPYVSLSLVEKQKNTFKEANIDIKIITFDGVHDIDKDILRKITKDISR